MNKNKTFLLVLALLLITQFSISQNNTNSPYTRFGYGDISDNNSGEQRAMGGVSIGQRSSVGINVVNPASYSSVDTLSFMFDVGASMLFSRFSDPNGSKTSQNANLEYITMQFPLAKWLGFSAGLLPYSFLGYDFYTTGSTLSIPKDPASDSISYTTSFNGTGGFNQVYSGLSANLFNHVSLGVNAYYMFGNMSNNRYLLFNNSTLYNSTAQQNTISASNFRFRYGAQVYNTFAGKHDVTLGLIYEQKTRLNGSATQVSTSVITERITTDSIFEVPEVYGIGLFYTFNKKLSLGIDYSMQEWENARFYNQTNSLNNRSKIALGAEYIPNPIGRNFSDRIKYRAGFNLSDAYYKIDGITPPKNFGISFGLGLPLLNRASNRISMLNATLEYGKIGSASNLREDYLKLNLNVTFNELWFFKRKL